TLTATRSPSSSSRPSASCYESPAIPAKVSGQTLSVGQRAEALNDLEACWMTEHIVKVNQALEPLIEVGATVRHTLAGGVVKRALTPAVEIDHVDGVAVRSRNEVVGLDRLRRCDLNAAEQQRRGDRKPHRPPCPDDSHAFSSARRGNRNERN